MTLQVETVRLIRETCLKIVYDSLLLSNFMEKYLEIT